MMLPPTPPPGPPQRHPRPHVVEAVELIGRRWTGVIVQLLLASREPLRFSDMAQAVPDLSDRMLSERLKELEERGVVARTVAAGPPVRVSYALTEMGRNLRPAMRELEAWGQRWL